LTGLKLPSFDYCNPEADLLELRQLEAGERYARTHGNAHKAHYNITYYNTILEHSQLIVVIFFK